MTEKLGKLLLSEKIYQELRSEIISGRRQPGERLVELEIASKFASSQAPVREAFRRLEEQGLIKIVRHTGSFVTDISLSEMQEMFELRAVIERSAIKGIWTKLKPSDFTGLSEIIQEMKIAAKEDDLERVIEMDMRFHQRIIQSSGKETAYRIWLLLDSQIRRFLMISHPRHFEDLNKVAQSHEELLEYMQRSSLSEAMKSIEGHILYVWTKISSKE